MTTPIYEETYREGVKNGYLEFLRDVAQVSNFYNFSGLNKYTVSSQYYFDASTFGMLVTNYNAEYIITSLEKELLE